MSARQVAMMVCRGVIRAVADRTGLQRLSIGLLAGEEKEGVERVQEYGFTSHPLPGGEVVTVFVGGQRDHGVIVATDDRRHRPQDLLPGEVAVYDNRGQSVMLLSDGIKVIAPLGVTVVGNMTVEGDVTADGVSLKNHTHTGDDGGSTSKPRAG